MRLFPILILFVAAITKSEAQSLIQRQETAQQAIQRQTQETRNVQRATVGIEIGEGTVEIILGIIRIATAAIDTQILNGEDRIAQITRQINGEATQPILREAIANSTDCKDDSSNCVRARRSIDNPTSAAAVDLGGAGSADPEQLFNVLERLLNTHDQLLRILGASLKPLTKSGEIMLRHYRKRLRDIRSGKIKNEFDTGDALFDGNQFNNGIDRLNIDRVKSDLTRLLKLKQSFSISDF